MSGVPASQFLYEESALKIAAGYLSPVLNFSAWPLIGYKHLLSEKNSP